MDRQLTVELDNGRRVYRLNGTLLCALPGENELAEDKIKLIKEVRRYYPDLGKLGEHNLLKAKEIFENRNKLWL